MHPIEKKFWRGCLLVAATVLLPFIAASAILGVLFTMLAGKLLRLTGISISSMDRLK